jgi:hypothetical protein
MPDSIDKALNMAKVATNADKRVSDNYRDEREFPDKGNSQKKATMEIFRDQRFGTPSVNPKRPVTGLVVDVFPLVSTLKVEEHGEGLAPSGLRVKLL